MRILVVNAGSSSLKLSLLGDGDALEQQAELASRDGAIDDGALSAAIAGWARPDVIGHRIVHGGTLFTGATRIDEQVERQLRALADLAPLHQPKSLAALDAVTAWFPEVPSVACFDTAFHSSIPPAAATYAIPKRWRDRYQIRRYGFHGLSHAYASHRAAELLDRQPEGLRVITCHLGAGASLAAVLSGRSVDTTMGFTPLEGLVMATRSGSVDPGLLLWLEEHEHLAPHDIATALETESGLLALTGTPDMRVVTTAAAHGDARAQLGLEVYLHRLAAGIAAMSAATAGVDALVFTGGVGENSAVVRSRTAELLRYLGVAVDANDHHTNADRDISVPSATVRTVVVTAREDLQIAREIRELAAS